jgi:hypothetical protein
MSFTDTAGTVAWGWTLQDNYGAFFDDTLEQEEINVKGLAFLRLVVKYNQEPSNESIRDLLITCWQHEKGLYIDGIFYDYDVVQEILEQLL